MMRGEAKQAIEELGCTARLPLRWVVVGPNRVEGSQNVFVAMAVTEAGHEGDVSLIDIA